MRSVASLQVAQVDTLDPSWVWVRKVYNGGIKMGNLYSDISNNYGSKYGIKYQGYQEGKSGLKSHLQKGEIALGGGMGHVMAVVAYNPQTDKYLILDSYPSSNRGTSSQWYTWKSQNQMTGKFNFTYFYYFGRR